MVSVKEMAWLHNLQQDLATKRDWVTVAHLQCVIDRIVDEHPFPSVHSEDRDGDTVFH